ncbi:MAG: YicC family protein [Prevotellaceae bacterium]|nr:YicC family protein [Prevotellaceae bacterium]
MIQSMTGYGKADLCLQDKIVHAEIRSLNSKQLDLSTRLAPLYREKEMEIRALIQRCLERGKVEFTLWIEKNARQQTARINADVAKAYAEQVREVCEATGMEQPTADGLWQMLMRMPDLTTVAETETLSEEEWTAVSAAVEQAVDALVAFRRQEGEALSGKFAENLDRIEALMHDIEPFEKARVEKIRQRLTERLDELKGVDYDRNRLEQELIYYIEKLDISEEKQRLSNHIAYFRATMNEEGGVGKKLGFIAQEMGREINTTGSKSNQAEMQNIVVRMKDELEQIKEQVLNVM